MNEQKMIRKTQKTPGPFVFYHDHDGCDEYLFIKDVARNLTVAQIYLPWDWTPADFERAAALASLFATAPKLLEALEALVLASCCGEALSGSPVVSKAIAVIAEVRAETAMEVWGPVISSKPNETDAVSEVAKED